MKNSIAKLLVCIASVCVLFSFTIINTAAAEHSVRPLEFGDYAGDSDFDFGGGYDSYDYDSYDSYDYDSYNYGSDDYDEDDYDFGGFGNAVFYGDGYSPSSYEGSSFSSVIGLIILIAIVVIVVNSIRNSKKKPVVTGTPIRPDPSLLPIADYLKIDPEFSESEFREKVSNLYVHFQHSWQAKDLADVRQYISDSLFAQVDGQLDSYRKGKKTNRVEDIAVQSVRLVGYKQEQGMDIIVAELRTRIRDYVVDDATGNVIKGDPSKEKFMCYRWSLARSTGFTTSQKAGFNAKQCPHCGAPIDINQSAVCEYCGSVLTDDTFDWVVNNIEAISQQTV